MSTESEGLILLYNFALVGNFLAPYAIDNVYGKSEQKRKKVKH